jgi:hypothetical protein
VGSGVNAVGKMFQGPWSKVAANSTKYYTCSYLDQPDFVS